MDSLLLEIGTEEIPAGYIKPALDAMASHIAGKLEDARIEYGRVQTYGTPRRLAVLVDAVADKQKALTTEVTGPPEKVGYDSDGNPLMPAVKFAEKLGISVDEIQLKETPKGRYLCAEKKEETLHTEEILKGLFPEMMEKIPFPKTMRWGSLDVTFARPVQSLLAILGKKTVEFTYGDIKSGNVAYGHRFMKPGPVEIPEPGMYVSLLRDADVIVDIEERKALVKEEIVKAAEAAGGKILPDEELVNIVANLIEYPVVVAGTFDTEFLELPDEVLITSMREHQKYFAVADENGKLMPSFVVVNNTRTRDMAVVTKGHEKVLRARLADAKFFYRADLEERSDARAEKLKRVLFQAKLGTIYDKSLRIGKLAEYLADVSGAGDELRQNVVRGARICKSDLVSQVVVEFTKLQGIMGRVYARHEGENEGTAMAVEEHYRPLYSGAELPSTREGALLSIADKIDTICGCFSVGLIPTGASDPYALRRQSIGIVQIMLAGGMNFSLIALIEKGIELYGDKVEGSREEIKKSVYDFFMTRMGHLLSEDGFSKDVIASVASISVDRVPDVWNRVKSLENLKTKEDFEPVAVAFKRVVNIIKKAELSEELGVDESLFEDACESALYASFKDVLSKVEDHLKGADYDNALADIASLRPPVDKFFDDVMVMAEDEKVKNNRLALLKGIAGLFADIADFSKIST